MAGYISGPIHEGGSIFTSIASHLLSYFIPISKTLLSIELAYFFLAPFFIILFIRNWGGTREQSWIGFGICTLMFCGLSFWDNLYGLLGFQLSCFMGLWLVSFFWKWIGKGDLKSWAILTIGLSVIFQIHPATLLIIGVPMALIYFINSRTLKLYQHALIGVTGIIVLVANLYWIKPYLAFKDWQTITPYYMTLSLKNLVNFHGPIQEYWGNSVRRVVSYLLIYLSIRALLKIHSTSPAKAWVLISWASFLAIISLLGSHLPFIRNQQPHRFLIPLFLLLTGISPFALDAFLLLRKKTMAFILPFVLVFAILWFPNLSFQFDLTQNQKEFIKHVKRISPLPGRLLIECAEKSTAHFSDYIPFTSGQLILGGSNPGNFLRTKFTVFKGNYSDGFRSVENRPMVFDRLLSEFNEEKFMSYLDLYNVSNIAAWSSKSTEILNSFVKILSYEGRFGDHNFYKVKRKSNWFFVGSGDLRMEYDKLFVKRASTGRIVIKSHWINTFKCNPPLPIKPVYLKDDPVPFISIDNSTGIENIEIFNAGL
ncbi:MAG: hypothetical protein LHV69_01715 [Elusimicrobia bacterium]|nr:hypothetical protein [Candidatus Obscuribacterium magneticum]